MVNSRLMRRLVHCVACILILVLGVSAGAWGCDQSVAAMDCCEVGAVAARGGHGAGDEAGHGTSIAKCHKSAPSEMTSTECCDVDATPEGTPVATGRARLEPLARDVEVVQVPRIALAVTGGDLQRQAPPDVHGPGLCALLSIYLL